MVSDPAVVHCTEHPDLALVRAYIVQAPVNVQADQRACPDPGHRAWSRVRCAYCGGPIGGRRPWARVYCGTRHRVAALRSRRTIASPPPTSPAVGSPGPTTATRSAAVETVQEVQE